MTYTRLKPTKAPTCIAAALLLFVSVPLAAQTTRIEPAPLPADTGVSGGVPTTPAPPTSPPSPAAIPAPTPSAVSSNGPLSPCVNPAPATPNGDVTYHKDDLIGAAEGVFGKGAKGLAQIIERSLKNQGEPNGYIVGREAAGAIVVGLRYGSGTLCHKIEGQRAAYWTGPSIGFDWGGDATKVFVLVYNLYDTQDL